MSEDALYLEHQAEEVYVFRHLASGRARARVVLAGAFGLERSYTYSTWARAGRALMHSGYDAIRFDPRGTGESTGEFNRLGPEDWLDDLLRVLDEVTRDDVPTVLMGFRFGGILASRAFATGRADGLLLWSPLTSGRKMLMDVLRRKLAEDFAQGAAGTRDRASLIDELMERGALEVDGYDWGRALWEQSEGFDLVLPRDDERPWQWVELGARVPRAAPVEHVVHAPGPNPPLWAVDSYLTPPVEQALEASRAFVSGLVGGEHA